MLAVFFPHLAGLHVGRVIEESIERALDGVCRTVFLARGRVRARAWPQPPPPRTSTSLAEVFPGLTARVWRG